MKKVLSFLFDSFLENGALIILLGALFAFALSYQNAIDKVSLLTEQVKVEKAAQEILRSAYIAQTEKFNSEVAADKLALAMAVSEIEKGSLKREADSRAKQAKETARLGLNFKREKERLSRAYEKRIKSISDSAMGADFSKLHSVAGEAGGASGAEDAGDEPLSDVTSGSEYTGSTPECHRDIADLIKACQLTTIHFNRAREWIDNACLTVKCDAGGGHVTTQ